jgi:hypothetical protein
MKTSNFLGMIHGELSESDDHRLEIFDMLKKFFDIDI